MRAGRLRWTCSAPVVQNDGWPSVAMRRNQRGAWARTTLIATIRPGLRERATLIEMGDGFSAEKTMLCVRVDGFRNGRFGVFLRSEVGSLAAPLSSFLANSHFADFGPLRRPCTVPALAAPLRIAPSRTRQRRENACAVRLGHRPAHAPST